MFILFFADIARYLAGAGQSGETAVRSAGNPNQAQAAVQAGQAEQLRAIQMQQAALTVQHDVADHTFARSSTNLWAGQARQSANVS